MRFLASFNNSALVFFAAGARGVFSLIWFSMYSGTVILENGEIVRLARSPRNQRPQTAQSSSPGSWFNFCGIWSSISMRFSRVCSNTSCLFSTCPEIASLSCSSQSGYLAWAGATSHTRAALSAEASPHPTHALCGHTKPSRPAFRRH